MSTPFQNTPGSSNSPHERNWLPLGISAGVIVVIIVALIAFSGHRKTGPAAIDAQPDAYAASLPVTSVQMSEAGNLAGSKVTYLDGHIANTGGKTVTGITVQVLFKNAAHQVVQNETVPMSLIRMREPYVDIQPVSAAPLASGDQRDFRLIFDSVSQDWDGSYPQVRVLHVDSK